MAIKLLITGIGRGGKDSACSIIKNQLNLNFISSSEYVGRKVIYPRLRELNNSLTWEQCFNSRHQNRKYWYDAITSYNTPDTSRLGRELFDEYDIYCGLRNINEFKALQEHKAFDLSIWIEAEERLRSSKIPIESPSSITITKEDCDIIIENNKTEKEFEEKIIRFCNTIKKYK